MSKDLWMVKVDGCVFFGGGRKTTIQICMYGLFSDLFTVGVII